MKDKAPSASKIFNPPKEFYPLSLILYPLSLIPFLFSPLFSAPNPDSSQYFWMDSLIEKNFTHFKEGITLESIEKTQNAREWITRYKVINNKVYAVKGSSQCAFAMLTYLSNTYGLPDLDILYFNHDGIKHSREGGGPIFLSSKKKSISQGLYFVDWYTVMPTPEWDSIMEEVNQVVSVIPWEQKKPQLIWRGASTDGSYTPETIMQRRRGKLCLLSQQYPELIDSKFVKYFCKKEDLKFLEDLLPLAPKMSFAEQIAYKYQIILDGKFTTFPGDRWRLLSNSVVFMHESAYGHWFHDALIPWVHFVPIKSDLSDLIEKINKIESDDAFARKLAENARKFALDNLKSEDIAVYCYKALLKYASLQKFKVELSSKEERDQTHHSHNNEVNCHNIVQQSRENKNQNPREQSQ